MKEYPSKIPSQRTRRPAAVEPVCADADNPSRRRPEAETMRQRPGEAAPRQSSGDPTPRQTSEEAAARQSSGAPTARQTSVESPTRRHPEEASPRQSSGDPTTRQPSGETSPRSAKELAALSRRARRMRQRYARRAKRAHTLRSVLTASATLCAILFLMPFLFSSDRGSAAVQLSGALEKVPETASAIDIEEPKPAPEPAPVQAEELVQETELPFVGQLDEDCFLRVLDKKNNEVSEMSMQEYLVCVLRGEMPGYFELEALKAQAVAARTYTRYMIHASRKHGDRADICTSPACCQAYLSAAAARQKWGYLPEDEERKIRAAVIETDGQTMLYDGEPILAVFHASSAGVTRTSSAVWSGDDKPYLQPVSSPENGDNTPNYYSHVEFTLAQLQDKLRSAFPKANLSGDVSEWLTDAERDAGGNIITVYVGGIKSQGSKVRSALGLRSACFTWEFADGKASFYVTGYGHGVGLSQYGANQMAINGASYREILTHYYTDIQIGGYTPG